jgi:hypothetical protein
VILKTIFGWLIGRWLDKFFENRSEYRRGAQEAASQGLEDANEKAKSSAKIDADVKRMSDDELYRRLRESGKSGE